MSLTMMDFLSAIFFIVAGLWLLAAIVYSLMVFYFLRLRTLNLLHTIHDDEFGRFYFFPKCGCRRSPNARSNDADPTTNDQSPSALPSPRQYYISFGWIFRRYARHLNIDAGNDHDAPRYKRSERREAVHVLLQQRQHKSRRNSKATSPLTLSSRKSRTQCRDTDGNAGNIFRRWFTSTKVQTNHSNVVGAASPQTEPPDESDLGIATTNDAYDHQNHRCNNNTLSLPMDEVPICSICLGPYDSDDCDEEHHTSSSSSSKNLDTPQHPTTTITAAAASGSANTVFQSSTCVHQFHMECILNWLQRKTNVECPCCRIPMIDDKEVWKTIQQLRKQKIRSMMQKQKQQRTTQHDDHIDETTNSETEHEGLP
jgi:Anaphase-promoting complex subunit 11 RING-H2 finger